MQSHINRLKIAVAMLSALALSACQSDVQPDANLKFTPPARIMQVRAIDRSQLRPVVTLSTGAVIPMQQVGDSSWTGTINVQANATYTISVEWIENLANGELVLARWTDNVIVNSIGAQIDLNNESYNYAIDTDGDSFTNIEERQNETDPFVPNDAINNGDQPTDDLPNNEAEDNPPNEDDPVIPVDDDTPSQLPDDAPPTNEQPPTQVRANVLVPRISRSQAPKIDGLGVELNSENNLDGEWAAAVQYDNSGALLSIDRLMIDNGADVPDGTQIRRWAAMHDGKNLYILVMVDDVGAIYGDSVEAWMDDNIEIFIDGDNSKLQDWGDDDDFHYLIPLLQLDTEEANNEFEGRFRPGPGSRDLELDLEFTTGPDKGPDGIRFPNFEQDVYEVAISIDSADIELGEEFGFEIQVDDDDNSGDRDSKWGWFHPSMQNGIDTDTTYLNPSVMGTLVLEE